MKKYLKVWYLLTINSFSTALISRFGAGLFLLGKVLRFFFFLGFLLVLVLKTSSLAGYNIYEVVFFFLTFNFLDTLTQLVFREVYRFRTKVISGSFDFDLVKPINPLFKVLAGGADFLDLLMLVPYTLFLVFIALKLNVLWLNAFFYILLLANGFLIALSFHVLVLSIGILTTEVDHSIMIYRDLTQMARIPIDIYKQPIRDFFTFIIPVGIMMTFPVKALIGFLSIKWLIFSFVFGGLFFALSILIWNYSLTQYSSASS